MPAKPSVRRSLATGPATAPQPHIPQPPPGFTATKDGPLVIFVRENPGAGMAKDSKHRAWVSCHEHRLHLGENVAPATITGITPSRLPAKKPFVLPMHVTPHDWRPRGL